MRRIYFLFGVGLNYILGTPLLGAALLIGLVNRNARREIGFYFNRLTCWIMLRTSGAHFITEGLENLPTDTPALYVCNHRSMLDIPAIYTHVKQRVVFVGKKSILKWPFIGWWMNVSDGLFLDRDNPRAGLEIIQQGIERTKAGESFVIFPEGTRSRTDEFLPFKQGSLRIAVKAGVPIIPISVYGTADVFEKNGTRLTAGPVFLTVGKPIDLSTLSPEDQKKSAVYVQRIIEDMYHKQMQLHKEAKAAK